jgi:hypothetical protein
MPGQMIALPNNLYVIKGHGGTEVGPPHLTPA